MEKNDLKNNEDERLLKQFRAGEKAAFARIVKKYSTDIAALANRLLGWQGHVDDIIQEVFLAAFLGLNKFRGKSSLKTWLFTITINKCRTHRRKELSLFRIEKDSGRYVIVSADDTLMNRETFDHIRRTVRALPVRYREPVVLYYLEELPVDEISRILKISKNAVEVRLSRARNRLRGSLADLIEDK